MVVLWVGQMGGLSADLKAFWMVLRLADEWVEKLATIVAGDSVAVTVEKTVAKWAVRWDKLSAAKKADQWVDVLVVMWVAVMATGWV